MSKVSNDCSIIVSSCDNYSDIWDPFFTLFHKFWPDNPYPVFLNTETLECHNNNIPVTSLKARISNISWTRRLKEALEHINTEYIIFMLDDFFIYDFVDTERIEEYLTYMREDPNIAAIYFHCLSYQMKMYESSLPGLEKCSHIEKSKLNLVIAIWKKNIFQYYLNHDENAWEFEANAIDRSLDRNDTFYAHSMNTRLPIQYAFTKYGLFAGKWFKSTVDLFKENGIVFDFSARGFYEDYEYGLIPYVAHQIKLDSYLITCYSLTRDNPRKNADIVVSEGHFSQKYDVSGSKDVAIWYPSDYGLYGFAIENFKCIIRFLSDEIKILKAEDVSGNFSLYQDTMFFLKPDMFVNILPGTGQEMSCIIIEGYMNKHLSRSELITAYNMDTRVESEKFRELLNSSKIYTEALLVPENFRHFRIYSKLCFTYSRDNIEEVVVYDGKDRFPGPFLQSYKIDKSADIIVRWDISAQYTGFAIENLQVEMIYSNGTARFLKIKNIKGNGIFMMGGGEYYVFLSSPAHLLFTLPKKKPDEIRISGNILAPIPRKILHAFVFDVSWDDIRRWIKIYGFFGVIMKAIKRVFFR